MYNESRVPCKLCDGDLPVVNYCEICHGTFCRACTHEVRVEEDQCGNCGGKTILQDSNGVKFCQTCKSENVRKISRTLRECPECRSTAVVNIQEKLLGVNRDFLEIVQGTREFIKVFDSIYHSFSAARQKLLNLRQGAYQALHYPSMDGELLNIFVTLQQSFENAWQRLREFYDHGKRHVKYFAVTAWTISQIPIVENLLYQVKDESKRTQEFLERLEERFQLDLKGIRDRLTFVEGIMQLFEKFRGQIILENGEKPVFALECNLHDVTNDMVDVRKGSGVILVTSKRVIFLHESGFFRKKHDVLFSLPLARLDNVEIQGRFFRKVHLEFQNGEYVFNLSKENQDTLVEFIEMAKEYDHYFVRNDTTLEKLASQDFKRHNLLNAMETAIEEVLSMVTGLEQYEEHLPASPQEYEQVNYYNTPLPYQSTGEYSTENPNRARCPPRFTFNRASAQMERNSRSRQGEEYCYGGMDAYEDPPLVQPPRPVYRPHSSVNPDGTNPMVSRRPNPQWTPRGPSFKNFSFEEINNGDSLGAVGPFAIEHGDGPVAGTTNPNAVWLRRIREKVARGMERSRQGFERRQQYPGSLRNGAPINQERPKRDLFIEHDGRPRDNFLGSSPRSGAGGRDESGKSRRAQELQREIWTINQVLEKLDEQYSSGKITKVDEYITNFRNLQRELFELKQELARLQ